MAFAVEGLQNRVVLVTGASSGIGRAVSSELAAQGAAVVVHYRSGRERAEEVVREITSSGGTAVALPADLTVDDEVRALVDAVAQHFGRLDILVNNAGDPVRRASFADVDADTLDRTIALNLRAPFVLTQAVLPMLRASRGLVLNIGTDVTQRGSSGYNLHYGIAKGGLNMFTIGLARELAPLGIRVNCLAPGITDTELHGRVSAPGHLEQASQRNLLKRAASPREIARIVVFLCSDDAAFIDGQVIYAAGG